MSDRSAILQPVAAPEDRANLGQWYTPAAVADLALSLALRGTGRGRRVLDPACGDGVFLARALAFGVAPEELVGVDVDPAAVAAAERRLAGGGNVVCADAFDTELGGPFDAVIGNPPYVRQERLSAGAKKQIRRRLSQLIGPEATEVVGRGDLAAAFVLLALAAVREGGRVVFVVSRALLDAGYGRALWRCVGRLGRVTHWIDAPEERWFADAAVNAVVLAVERGAPVSPADRVEVARLNIPTEEAARRVVGGAPLCDVAEVRRVRADAPDSWAAAVRGSQTWFDFAEAAGSRLVPLGDIAEVSRGVTSGSNRLFYLSRPEAARLRLEADLLTPLVRSPRESGAERIAIDPDRTTHLALTCPPEREELERYPRVAAYFDERRDQAERPTLRARPSWWALPARPARLFLAKAYANRFVQRLSPRPLVADQRVYLIHPRDDVDTELVAAVLNSTFTAFALESLGRASMGEGALEWTVADAATLPVLDPRRLGAAAPRAVELLRAMSTRIIGTVSEERGRADRRALDRAVAGPALYRLAEPIQTALIASVTARTGRARTGRALAAPLPPALEPSGAPARQQ